MLEMAFYCGLSILYPYSPVYCPTEDCRGDCRGVYLYHSKSAPLPMTETRCVGFDLTETFKRYEWEPRLVAPDRQESLNAVRVCYWEDRGEPK